MSASLVGSEMCIRDRCPGVLCPADRRRDAKGVFRHVQPWAERRLNTPDTVSYTHLTLPTICSV
eukprot:5408455-Alexandrium_andersonii.AAC.1